MSQLRVYQSQRNSGNAVYDEQVNPTGGELAVTQGAFTLTASGTVQTAPSQGQRRAVYDSQKNGSNRVFAANAQQFTGLSMGAFTLSASGQVSNIAGGNTALPLPTLVAEGEVDLTGTATVAMGAMTLTAIGGTGTVIQGQLLAPMGSFTSQASGGVVMNGIVQVLMGQFELANDTVVGSVPNGQMGAMTLFGIGVVTNQPLPPPVTPPEHPPVRQGGGPGRRASLTISSGVVIDDDDDDQTPKKVVIKKTVKVEEDQLALLMNTLHEQRELITHMKTALDNAQSRIEQVEQSNEEEQVLRLVMELEDGE